MFFVFPDFRENKKQVKNMEQKWKTSETTVKRKRKNVTETVEKSDGEGGGQASLTGKGGEREGKGSGKGGEREGKGRGKGGEREGDGAGKGGYVGP